jgi:hypothetical protein
MTRWLGAITAGMLLVACGGGQTPPVDAQRALHDSATAMAQLKTVSATVKLTKGTITLQGFTLVSAKTSVRLPSDSDTVYMVKEQDVTIGLQVVITDGHVYLHVPFSTFQELSSSQAAAFPDMAKLFDPTTGLPAVIPSGANPRYVSTDQLDGKTAYQISTSYSPDQVHSLFGSLNPSGPVAAQVWVGTSDHYIYKAVLDGAFGDGGKQASVEVDISNFNGTVTITSPST